MTRSAPPRITLLTRPGCHLCEQARTVIARVATELGVPWEERDVNASEQDLRAYSEMVPVTLVDGVPHDYWRVDEGRLRATLCKRSQERSVGPPSSTITRPPQELP